MKHNEEEYKMQLESIENLSIVSPTLISPNRDSSFNSNRYEIKLPQEEHNPNLDIIEEENNDEIKS